MVGKAFPVNERNEWETPQWFFDSFDENFHFSWDLAANESNYKCENYYTEKDNALVRRWNMGGWLWCNPPYGRNLKRWVAKAYQESRRNRAKIAMLIPASVGSQYWHQYIWNNGASKVFFFNKRIKFLYDGKEVGSPAFDSALVLFDYSPHDITIVESISL